MLNITYTNTTIQGHKSLYRLLENNNKKDTKHIFIVPDRFTLGVEKEICNYCYPDGSFNVSVQSITRLATKALGNRTGKCLSKEGTVVLLNRVIKENNDSLNYYKSIKSYQFSKEMFAAIASLRNSNLCVEEIKNAIPLFFGVTKEKLTDIALIYEKYLEALNIKYVDTITRIDALINNIKEISAIKDSHIYFLGFNIYSSQQLKLIKELLLYCPSVNLSVTNDSFGTNKIYFPCSQIEEIIGFCKDKNVEIKVKEEYSILKEPFNHLHKNLFGFNQQILPENDNKVTVFNENNPYEEVKAVAKEINYLVKSKGYRYKDISLVCNNNEYLSIISEIFDRCEVPCFIEKKYYIKDSILLKYIYSLYNCVCGNYQRLDILKLLHHPFANIESEDIIIFENYIKKYNIEYSMFLKPFILGDHIKAEEIRKLLLKQLLLVPSNGATVYQNCEFVSNLILREDIAKRLLEHSQSQEEKLFAGSKTEGFSELLAEISELIGEENIDTMDFLSLLQSATFDMSVSLLPRYIDVVFVGNTTQSRFSEQKVIFVLGANRGYFPLQKGDNIIFTAMDAEIMKGNGLNMFPSPFEYNGFEQFIIIDLMTKAEKIYIGYSRFSIMGETLSVGEGVREIEYILQKQAKALIRYNNFSKEEELIYNLVNTKNAYYEYMYHKIPLEYRQATYNFLTENGYKLDIDSVSEKSVIMDSIFKKDDKNRYFTSVSQLEEYFKCPFRHFLSYGLRLKEEEDGDLNIRIKGIFIHNVLENYFKANHKELKTVKDYFPLIQKAIKTELNNSDYSGYMNNPMNVYALKNICNECSRLLGILTENYRKSLFEPKYFEFSFGDEEDKLITLDVDGKIFNLRGKIDRVDFYKDYVLIVDYKTGQAGRELREEYYGKKIQLYVYLKYFLNEGYKAGGVFYLPIKSGYTKDGKFYPYTGHIVDKTEIYCAIDGEANNMSEETFESKILPYTLINKNGETVIKKIDGVITQQNFAEICTYIFDLIKENLRDLLEGDLSKSPLKGECKNCSYKNICGQVSEREYSPKKVADFKIEEKQC